jgi:hypothetical protein
MTVFLMLLHENHAIARSKTVKVGSFLVKFVQTAPTTMWTNLSKEVASLDKQSYYCGSVSVSYSSVPQKLLNKGSTNMAIQNYVLVIIWLLKIYSKKVGQFVIAIVITIAFVWKVSRLLKQA